MYPPIEFVAVNSDSNIRILVITLRPQDSTINLKEMVSILSGRTMYTLLKAIWQVVIFETKLEYLS